MSNAVQRRGICKTVCAQGCVGFPRAVLCSSSSEFLERSLLSLLLEQPCLQGFSSHGGGNTICVSHGSHQQKGAGESDVFKANLLQATSVYSSALKGFKGWHSQGELQGLASRALGMWICFVINISFP